MMNNGFALSRVTSIPKVGAVNTSVSNLGSGLFRYGSEANEQGGSVHPLTDYSRGQNRETDKADYNTGVRNSEGL